MTGNFYLALAEVSCQHRTTMTQSKMKHSSRNNEWQTPDYVLRLVRQVLGDIDVPGKVNKTREFFEAFSAIGKVVA